MHRQDVKWWSEPAMVKVSDDIYLHESATVTIFVMPTTGWKVAVVVPDSRLQAAVSRLMEKIIFWLIAALMVILLLAYFLLRTNLLLPLRDLTGQLEKLSTEPEDALRELEFSSANELGELVDHFNRRTRQLALSRKRYRELFDSAKDAIIVHDASGRIIDVNSTMLEMYQVSDRETACRLSVIKDLSCPGNDIDEVVGEWQLALQGEKREFGWRARRYGDGLCFDAWVTFKRNPDVEDVIVIATVADITEKLRNEKELQKISKIESLGVLAGGIAHDFNNLLAGIFGNISLARKRLPSDCQAAEYLKRAENALDRATALTRQLLTFAKGGQPLTRVVDIVRLVKESAEFVVRGSNVNLKFVVADRLWTVEVDAGQMGQVISNLVINADQAMPAGGTITLTIKNWQEDDGGTTSDRDGSDPAAEVRRYVRIIVADQGPGIPAADLERIFDPYFTTKSTGSGLGLALCFSIVRRHGGYISVSSEPGCGAVFTIDIPAREGTAEGDGELSVAVSPRDPQLPDEMGSLHILVMDDEPALRELLSEMLQTFGHRVVAVADGRQAVEAFSRALAGGRPFDCVIVDLTIPGGVGGVETMALLRDIDPGVKVIVSSGYSTDPVMANYRDYGFVGCLSKPFLLQELRRVLETVRPGVVRKEGS
jgi:PAS domain S-box-containing protein